MGVQNITRHRFTSQQLTVANTLGWNLSKTPSIFILELSKLFGKTGGSLTFTKHGFPPEKSTGIKHLCQTEKLAVLQLTNTFCEWRKFHNEIQLRLRKGTCWKHFRYHRVKSRFFKLRPRCVCV